MEFVEGPVLHTPVRAGESGGRGLNQIAPTLRSGYPAKQSGTRRGTDVRGALRKSRMAAPKIQLLPPLLRALSALRWACRPIRFSAWKVAELILVASWKEAEKRFAAWLCSGWDRVASFRWGNGGCKWNRLSSHNYGGITAALLCVLGYFVFTESLTKMETTKLRQRRFVFYSRSQR